MIDKCPGCGASITLEPATTYGGDSALMKLLYKLLKSTSLTDSRRRGQFIFTCKVCGKAGMICVD